MSSLIPLTLLTLPAFPGGSAGKESLYNAEDPGSVPGSGRSPEEGNDNLLQYSYLVYPMDREAWQASVYGLTRVRHNLTKPPLSTNRVC